MKCKSLACIWSGSPPLHRVTAVAAFHEPPSLYTGGSDGSIIWWNLISSSGKTEMKPVAMLCGHTAPIADLGICFSLEASENGKVTDSGSVLSYPNSINCGALISACRDGVLCVWSRAGGHCRRRRKLPPWAGSPVMIRPWPNNTRYVCINCCFVIQEEELLNSVEGNELCVDRELQNPSPLKCTVLIVDSLTLTIVQTIFHGNVSIGPLKSMAVVLPSEDMEMQSVLIIDSFSKVLYLPITTDPNPKGENVPALPKDFSVSEVMDWADDSKEEGSLVAVANCGYLLALVHRTYCTFRPADCGTVFGKISFLDDQLCSEDKLYIVGGIFLGDDASISKNGFVKEFVVWNNRGTAVIYNISYSSSIFKFDPLFVIPPVLHPSDVRLSFSFIPLRKYLLRVESICFPVRELKSWRPHVTVWLLPQQNGDNRKFNLECEMMCQGNLFDDWAAGSYLPKNGSLNHDVLDEGQLVSSSMVISENHLAPYAIVYGFFSGDIEIVRFHMFFTALGSLIESTSQEAGLQGQNHRLSGHNGAVICLASRQMVSGSGGCSSKHVLLSGSMDCTVRVWDLDSDKPIMVLHQHVAPVRKIVLPPSQSEYPLNDCFLTVGDDSCVALVSLHTLRVERMFPGHMYFPSEVLWDGVRNYIACLCPNRSEKADALDVLYIWDVKTGARERVLRGAAAHSMFDHFLKSINGSSLSGDLTNGNTSGSSLVFSVVESKKFPQSYSVIPRKGISPRTSTETKIEPNAPGPLHATRGTGVKSLFIESDKHPIKSSCPFPGVSTLCFDLDSIMSLCSIKESSEDSNHTGAKGYVNGTGTTGPKDDAYPKANASSKEPEREMPDPHRLNEKSISISDGPSLVTFKHHECAQSLGGCLLQFSLSFLHLWNVDNQLDNLLVTEMKLNRPDSFIVSSGILGDRGSMTLTFPGSSSTLELWRSSSEYSALRSLTMVSLAQHLTSLSHSCSSPSSALAAFYTQKFAEKISDIKPPLLQLLVSFWQNKFEHVKMAARSLFHCAASRAIPLPLCCTNANQHAFGYYPYPISEEEHGPATAIWPMSDGKMETKGDFIEEERGINSWLESYEMQDWISCVGGTTQDAMTSQIIVAAALAVWYPSLVKRRLPIVVVHPLVKLVMATNEKYSSAAAEILAEGMESKWKACIGSEIPHLIGDIFFQLECVSGTSTNAHSQNAAASLNIRETLVGILLPSLAMADIPGYLHAIESQIWSTASDSPVHVVALMTLIRVVRGSPRNLSPYLDKVVIFILQTMDPGNSTMRRSCLQSSMAALKEVVCVFPMIALNDTSTRLAVGDAIGEIRSVIIRVYDMQSMTKIKVLDASGPPGLPNLLGGTLEKAITTAISALSFSPDGEGLVAFSENGLMIRWWSLGSVWWEKLSRNHVPVQCTKVIFVPPWEGFSPNCTRSSIMASVLRDDGRANSPGNNKAPTEMDRLKLLIHNLDLSYRLEWVGDRKVKLSQHSHELGTFQL